MKKTYQNIAFWLLVLAPFIFSKKIMAEPQVNQEEIRSSPPFWIKNPPSELGILFVVGESSALDKKEDALEGAWANGLVRIGMAEFPELSQVRLRTVETLTEVDYRKDFVMKLEWVDWTGLKEASDLGSPFVIEKEGKWVAYRLFKWGVGYIEKARLKIKAQKIYGIPLSPEVSRSREEELSEAVRKINDLNQNIEYRDQQFAKVLNRLKCGVTAQDLIKILGNPDRTNGVGCNLCRQSYYWGTYEVEANDFSGGVVTEIKTGSGYGKSRSPCFSY